MQGKVALVTGGTAGIGRAAAVAFARQGAHVVVCGRREAAGEQAMQLIREAGSDGFFMQADVADAVLFLMKNGFVTGITLTIDGGGVLT